VNLAIAPSCRRHRKAAIVAEVIQQSIGISRLLSDTPLPF
jgi:hypothetical protein